MVDLLSTGALAESVGTVTTSGTSVVLTSTSKTSLRFLGTANQTVALPPAATCFAGQHFSFANRSSGVVTVYKSDLTTLVTTINPTAESAITLFDATAGTWDAVTATSLNFATKTSAYTAAAGDFIFANTSGGAFTLGLPAGANFGDRVYVVTVSPNTLTVALSGSDTINGSNSSVLVSKAYSYLAWVSNGSGSWITLAASGGASSTYVAKTANYTAFAGDNILADTTAGPFTITLPGFPSLGDQIVIMDAGGTFGTNALTIAHNGNNILGAASDALLNQSMDFVTLVYYNVTRGWVYR